MIFVHFPVIYWKINSKLILHHLDDLVQACSISITNTLEILQSYTKLLIYSSLTGERLTEGPFRIAASSGILTLVGQLDKTQVAYRLNIKATDNGRCCGGKTSRSSFGQVIVQVKDVNNNAPKFPDCSSYQPTVLEREDVGTSVIRVSR